MAAVALLLPRAAAADDDKPSSSIAVIPLGKGDALAVTASAARGVADRLADKRKAPVALYYTLPQKPPPAAESPQADALVTKAFKAFQNLDFATVREQVGQALALYKKHIEAGGSTAGYVHALHLLAAAELFDGQQEAALRAMKDAVLFDREPPPKKLFNPTVQQLHEKVLAESDQTGKLRCDSEPAALVFTNGRLAGPSGQALALKPGLQLITVFRPGFNPKTRWVRVRAGQTDQQKLALTKGGPGEPPEVTALRKEVDGIAPGEATAQARQASGAEQLILIAARPGCKPASCTVRLRWAAESGWKRTAEASVGDDVDATAKALLEGESTTAAAVGSGDGQTRTCTMDSQCFMGQKCIGGVCRRAESVTRKWWFWTLIVAAAAGVATAIAVPLTLSDSAVIQVK